MSYRSAIYDAINCVKMSHDMHFLLFLFPPYLGSLYNNLAWRKAELLSVVRSRDKLVHARNLASERRPRNITIPQKRVAL